MLKLHNEKDKQMDIFEAGLPKELFELDEELKKIDEFLNDERFMEPFLEHFNSSTGRPTVPVETYLRMMYLKHRHGIGYETLVKEISDSIKWRTFCKLKLTDPVPDSTTLIKATKRYGEKIINEINELLVEKAREKKVIRGRKLRVDSTTVEADIHYPTDASLLADGIKAVSKTIKKLKKSGEEAAQDFRDRTRSAKKRAFKASNAKGKKDQINKITSELVEIAEKVVGSAKKIKDRLEDGHLGTKLGRQTEILEQVIQQTKEVLTGNTHIPDRVVSIFDPEARPLKRGNRRVPVEFGRKLCLTETEERIITGYDLKNGNPSDTELLFPAIEKHINVTGKLPWAIAADAGFASAEHKETLIAMGVKRVALRLRGRKKEYEKESWYKRLQRFRAGIEGTISLLKRKYGLKRSLYKGTAGSRQWVGFGIMAYNLQRIDQLV
jgi:IS5 family transposase